MSVRSKLALFSREIRSSKTDEKTQEEIDFLGSKWCDLESRARRRRRSRQRQGLTKSGLRGKRGRRGGGGSVEFSDDTSGERLAAISHCEATKATEFLVQLSRHFAMEGDFDERSDSSRQSARIFGFDGASSVQDSKELGDLGRLV